MKKRIISIFLIFMLVSMNICNAQDTLSNEQVQALLTGYVNENAPDSITAKCFADGKILLLVG